MAQARTSWLASKSFLYDSVFADRGADLELLQHDAEAARAVAADWQVVTAWMMPKSLLHLPGDHVFLAITRLRQVGMIDRLLDWYIDVVRSHFAMHAIPALKNPIIQPGALADADAVSAAMQRSLATLCDALKHYMYSVTFTFADGTSPVDAPGRIRFRNSLNAMIDIALSDYEFQLVAHMFVEQQLAACCTPPPDDDDDEMEVADESAQQHALLSSVRERIGVLEIQDLMDRVVAEVYHKFIQRYVVEQYARKWDREDGQESALSELRNTVHGPIARCVGALVRKGSSFEERLYELAAECLAHLRIEEMFDMVIFFPDSIPALEDLKALLKTQQHRAHLVRAFQSSCQRRLLHCGANTSDIISFYLSAIKVFKMLEPRGVLLDRVSRPIRRYLRERDDTVKCIVNGMLEVEDGNGGDLTELSKELASVAGANAEAAVDDSDFFDMNWAPDPVDAAPDFRNKRSLDFIGSFVSLYESKEVFVREIAVVLANRLLDLKTYEIDRELMHLELLKLRFGEAELHNCDVMVKDISESKRVDANIHDLASAGRTDARAVHASILSRLFWPSFRDDELVIPAPVEEQLERYAERFSVLKPGRKLRWLKRLGNVDVTLELEDRTLTLNVSPERASVIYLFQERPAYYLSELTAALRLDEAAGRRSVAFWINKGVLKEDEKAKDRYILLERAEEASSNVLVDAVVSSVQTAEEKATEEMRVYWSYIVGMLTNLHSLPISRIQSFLKMLIPKDMGYSRSMEELQDFLTAMVAEEKLEYVGGSYRLRKDSS